MISCDMGISDIFDQYSISRKHVIQILLYIKHGIIINSSVLLFFFSKVLVHVSNTQTLDFERILVIILPFPFLEFMYVYFGLLFAAIEGWIVLVTGYLYILTPFSFEEAQAAIKELDGAELYEQKMSIYSEKFLIISEESVGLLKLLLSSIKVPCGRCLVGSFERAMLSSCIFLWL
ncbi:hypothetical protein ACJX0J_040166 [Zea mays]